jgi:peptide/nickel transport system substrate-binding protein
MTVRKLSLLVLLGAVACGGDGDAPPGPDFPDVAFCQEHLPAVEAFLDGARATYPTPDDPRYGGTAVMGFIGELTGGLNGAVSTSTESSLHQQFVAFMTLLDYDENLDPRPYLADSIEVADDNTSVTFHLRRDVFWHDGERTDAHDVAFTYRTVVNPETSFPNPAYWDLYDRSDEGVEVIDDFTVRMHLQPHPEFLDPWRQVPILPEHLLGDVPPAELAQHPFNAQCPIGNGPFVFLSHAEQDRWEFAANPAFPNALGGRPFLDRYVYRIIPEQSTLLAELMTGGIDVYMAPNPNQAQRIAADPDVELVRFPSRIFVFVAWNARREQLADPRVRRALTMGTNRADAVQAILQGYGRVADGTVPPFHWAYEPDGPGLEYDPDGARALLDEAGWIDRDGDGVRENADGVPLELVIKTNDGNAQRRDLMLIMQAQLADLGVSVDPQVVEGTTLMSQVTDADVRDFDGFVMGFTVEFKLSDMDLFHSDRERGLYAFSGTENPQIDRYLEAIAAEVDRDRARELWHEYQALLVEEQPFTFAYFPDRLAGVSTRLRNVEMDARGELLNVREWYIDPERR